MASAIISEVVHNSARRLPEHSHELAFFTLLIDGSYSESYGRKNFSYKPFTILWHPSGISHQDEIGSRGGRFFSVEITKSGLDSLKEFSKVPEDFHERGSSLVWLSCRLYHEFRNWEESSGLIAEGITLEMLGQASRNDAAPRKGPPKWLNRVIERLDDDFADSPSSAELAKIAGVHPVHLAAVFRKFKGVTVGEYLNSRRIEFACARLTDRNLPLVEIAIESGFSDQSHFTRVFRKVTGITPGAFRNSL